MDILSKSFRVEVIGPDGRKTEAPLSGLQAIALIAHAEVIAPQITRLCDDFEQFNQGKRGFDKKLTRMAIAQATMRLSSEIDTEEELFSRGVLGLSALTGAWNQMNQLTFQYLMRLDPQSPEFLRRQVQLQRHELQLAEHRELLDVFRRLQAK